MKRRGDWPGWVALMLIGIVGGITGVPAIPGGASDEDTGQNCTHWNTPKFFKTASVEDVTACLRAGANPKAQDEDGRTPLHHIARGNGNPSMVAALLQSGADPNARTRRGWTPLHGAALSASSNMEITSPDLVTALIKAGADPNARDTSGQTPLFYAAWYGAKNPATIAALVQAGADPRVRDEDGQTPLHKAAAAASKPEIVAALLEVGLDPEAQDEDGSTPLHEAAMHNENAEFIAVLVKAGADPDARDETGAAPLHQAAGYNENPQVIAGLIRAGADPNAKDQYGQTPLHQAAEAFSNSPDMIEESTRMEAEHMLRHFRDHPEGTAEIIRMLEDPSALARFTNPSYFFALAKVFSDPAIAKSTDDTQIVSKLTQAGRKAAEAKAAINLANIAELLKGGADLNARTKTGDTPLHSAAKSNTNPAVIAALVEAGADPNARAGFSRETPLYLAKKRTEPNPEVIAALEKAGAETHWIEIMFFKYLSLPIVTALAASAFRRWRRTARPTPSAQEPVQPV